MVLSLRRAMLALVFCSLPFGVTAQAARPAQDLLPPTTKGYISIPSLEEISKAWNATQLGQLVNDPVMKPFIEDLQRQFKSRLSASGVRLGITWDDLKGVASGEVAVATIQPQGDKARCATVLLADITGNQEKANELLRKISQNLTAKGAKKETQSIGGVSFSVFTLPKKKPTDRQAIAYYAIHQDQLIAVDDQQTAGEIVGRFQEANQDSLRHHPAFAVTKERTSESFAVSPHLHFYLEPFGYTEVSRAYAGGRKKRGTDLLRVLTNQGFDCVRGLGGQVAFSTGSHEIHYQTFIYAPAVVGPDGQKLASKYRLAARMLDFPAGNDLVPQSWIPTRLATYLTFNWKIQEAFWYAESLVNEVAGADVFREVLNDIEKDPNGPQVNVDKEFVKFLGRRVTVLSDYREPINTKSERVLLAVEVSDPQSVMATVNKTMRSDRNAKEITIKGHTIWEMTQEEEFAVEEIKIDGVDLGGGLGDEDGQEANEDKVFRPNAAVTVAHGHFIIATHVDYIVDLLEDLNDGSRLSDTADYKRVGDALTALGSDQDSFRCFARTDQAYRVTYEMVRQGKMPEAETLLAKLLNALFAPDEEESLRPQQIDGARLPEFSQVQHYLGPAGLFIRSEDDGWYVHGCVLNKPQE